MHGKGYRKLNRESVNHGFVSDLRDIARGHEMHESEIAVAVCYSVYFLSGS